MPINYNDAPEQRSGELIPDGTFVRLVMHIRPGQVSMTTGDLAQDAQDQGLFVNSKSSDAIGLDCEFTVEGGEHDKRKLFQWMTVAGGSLDDKGNSKGWNMTKQTHRAMIDSALGLDPKDMSAQASASRQIPSFASLNGIGFWAKIGVEEGQEIMQSGQKTGRYYDPKNTIERIVVPGDAEYADLRAGKSVPPKPKHAPHAAAASPQAGAKPAWGGGAVAAPASSQGGPSAHANGPTAAPATAPAAAAPPPGAAPANRPAWLSR